MQFPLPTIFVILFAVFISCSSSSVHQDENKLPHLESGNDTCDDPDSDINCCFVNMPDDISEVMVIAGEKEDGERLIIFGKVVNKDMKTPVKNAIIYAYHTDSKGLYSRSGNETGAQKWHGKLHGWCKTNAEGRYEIRTIRPASYPNSTAPAHIHAAVKLPEGVKPFYIKDFVFDDDPFVDEDMRNGKQYGVGEHGVVNLKKENGIWIGERDLVIE